MTKNKIDDFKNEVLFSMKENTTWNFATHHLRRAAGFDCIREVFWIKSIIRFSIKAIKYENNVFMKFARKLKYFDIYQNIRFKTPIRSNTLTYIKIGRQLSKYGGGGEE